MQHQTSTFVDKSLRPWQDSIVAETRKHRQLIAAEAHNDMETLFTMLYAFQTELKVSNKYTFVDMSQSRPSS